jgi:pimeloyl-ACP methyl ester carboxylesterase
VGGLEGDFILAGHSAGGGFAAATAADFLAGDQDDELAGVVMFDGVSNGVSDGSFAAQVDALQLANIPIYQIAAPAQAWNAYGATTNALLTALGNASPTGGTFAGVVLAGGSHVDSMLGVNPIFDFVLQLVVGRVPAGNTAAVYTLSTGWINDMYSGVTPYSEDWAADGTATYGYYAGANQAIILGPATALALPSPVLNQLSLCDKIVTSLIDAVGGIFGFSILPDPVNTGSNGLTSVITPTLPNGVIWLQHGFLGFNTGYSDLATRLA